MKKLSLFAGFGRRSILSVSATGAMACPRMAETESNRSRHKRAEPRFRYLGRILAALGAIALLIGGGWYYQQRSIAVPPAVVQTSTGYISNDQLEAQYGVRITLIGVSAVGGIVDFRYKLVDPAKAAALLHDPENAPVLTAVDSGLTLAPTQMGSRHHSQMGMKKGTAPFTFYPNVRNAVKAGTPVSVAFGKIKVEPIVAQ
jgi:hypothetical protein